MNFNVLKEERRDRNFKIINKAKFEQFFVIADTYLFSQKNNINQILKTVAESANYSKNLYIEYFTEIGMQKAEYIKSELAKMKINNVKIRQSLTTNELRFADINSILSIMIEKY